MKRSGGWKVKHSSSGKKMLLAFGMMLFLSSCSREQGEPFPPHSPPRPMTEGGHVITMQLDLAERPVNPPPGEM
ncbi:MAG TPA: hypothetical protein VJ654_02340 [Noviherbaspirillum sp.]|nr:hypothetical protein [Noviherbaspirillum sp.]